MKLKDLSNEEILTRVLASDKLNAMFKDYVTESEMDYIEEILGCFNSRCADWSIGPHNHNYFHCTNATEFVYRARDMADCFSGSEKTLKLLAHCEKLRDTNLFEHYADKLAESIEDELCRMVRGIEDVCFEIHLKRPTDTLLDYIECFVANYLDDVLIEEDETNNRIYRIEYL